MSKILTILKYIGAFSGATITLWGVFSLIDTIQDGQVKQSENHQVVLQRLDKIETNIDSLYIVNSHRDGAEAEIKEAITRSENRLIYYIKHQGNMTNEQILDAFELGIQEGKKKDLTLSEMIDGIQ
jgi:hypothetical protein